MGNVSKRITVGVAVLGLVATFGLTALAQQAQQTPPAQQSPGQGGPGRPWGRGMWGPGPRGHAMALGFALGQLDLTAAQREQVHAIMQQHQAEWQALAQQTRTARLAVNEAVQAPALDEAAIKTASANLAEVETEIALLRARVRSEVLQVLTPEQRAKAETLKVQMRQRMDQRRGRAVPPPQ